MKFACHFILVALCLTCACNSPLDIDTPRQSQTDRPASNDPDSLSLVTGYRISVLLALDASGSMDSVGLDGATHADAAKAGALRLVDYLDGSVDEAGVEWFNSIPTIAQSVVTYPILIKQAIRNVPASGNTSLWDGIYFGLTELVNNGVNESRGVVVFTDGRDNGSIRTPTDLNTLASRSHSRIFIIGYGEKIAVDTLRAIADSSRGAFYQVSSKNESVTAYLKSLLALRRSK
jgi:Mg-chelatase subunit ChlD